MESVDERNLQSREEPKSVLDSGELGQEEVHAKPQENQHEKITSEFLIGRGWQNTFYGNQFPVD